MATVTLIEAAILIIGGVVSVYFFSLARSVRRADSNEYRNARLLSGNLSNVLGGRVKSYHDGVRDPRVQAGLAIDRRTNKWVPHGALSKDTIDNVFN